MIDTDITIVSIRENESYHLSVDESAILKDMVSTEPELPINIENDTLIPNNYVVGSIQFGNKVLNIMPRNDAFTLSKYFEMQLFIESDIVKDLDTAGYSDDMSFGVNLFENNFSEYCEKLLRFGLTGGYESEIKESLVCSGEIVFDRYHYKEVPIKGLTIKEQKYSLDVIPNRVIKAAILKIVSNLRDEQLKIQYLMFLKHFENISDQFGNLNVAEERCNKFYSANPQYPLVTKMAIKILRDYKISYSNGKLVWSSFLFNSNDVYEKYIRKILEQGLNHKISKWSEPKFVAKIIMGGISDEKTYVPDVLVDYSDETGTAFAVIDAKNKYFDPINMNLTEVISSSDLYQLMVYCNMLKTNIGALIYPSKKNHEVVELYPAAFNKPLFRLLSINMTLPMVERHNKLVSDVKIHLLSFD